ncbi:helix-turn-helix domain-containing protein [Staphylococcus simulans]|uniref:helix-turn-helix domain-containing protein n=1 Tax=Staphylococcus simulans TaxID=1286 RepID=UPI0021D1A7BD|nr:helix-turn-helix domain-containing protein [Staphylococcus simulans]MDQ7113630.1 helix-turn-helix domain-containing protein [Staphylococcus simulans]MDQ7117087.1 helix-turn-helix domain-containing protein [Staphylococcus simulans]UXR34952.1 helix-turn-helix domain-containing protein [Staphylococcus simulans]
MENFNLGSFLRKKREEKGLTTRDLGKKIGYSYSYIAGVEKGHKVNPSVAFLENYIYTISKNIHEISQIKEEISKGTNGKYYPDFFNVKKNSVQEIESNQSMIKAILSESSPNVMFYEENGLIIDKYFKLPMNDVAFHLNDKYNEKYFRKIKMTDEDRKYIYNLINEYFIRKVEIQLQEIKHNKGNKNIDGEVADNYIKEYEGLIKKLNDPNDLKY